jgi:dihydroneopterin aldolase
MTLTIELYGLELHGRHGVLDDERREGQRFLFDVWLDVAEPERDSIEATLDYREVAAAVREISGGTAFHLLETLASTLARELVTRFPIQQARVRVRKPDVEIGEPIEWTAVTATASSSARASAAPPT